MAKTYSCILVGVEVHVIEIETVIGNGFSGLNILGLPSDATRDMRERIRSALESIGISIPARRVIVNFSTSELLKLSRTYLTQLDFPVAACIIRALFEEKKDNITLFKPNYEFLAGELSLSAELKPIQNSLIYETISTDTNKPCTVCLPYEHDTISPHFEYFKNLKEWFEKRKSGINKINKIQFYIKNSDNFKLSEEKIKTAQTTIELLNKNPKICVASLIATAGKHNLLVAGEPGIGKSYAIKRFPALLLPLKDKEKIEVKLIHSSSNINEKPFRFPHHSCTSAALIGGASLKPGEVTLAHHGILFLDELAEFSRSSLEALREPLDSGCVRISRANGNILYPAKFQLCAATNPCGCGYLFSKKKPCRCNPNDSKKYLQKISGPLLDRFCLQIWPHSKEEESQTDIFCEFLSKIIFDKKLDEFTSHFFRIQEELATHPRINNLNAISSKFNPNLSLRGNEKLLQITNTFKKLFPSLQNNKKFYDDILSYRRLEDLFSKNY